MYATKAVNDAPAIQRDGRTVMIVYNHDWRFASWLCALLNELSRMPDVSVTERDRVWLEAMDVVGEREAQRV